MARFVIVSQKANPSSTSWEMVTAEAGQRGSGATSANASSIAHVVDMAGEKNRKDIIVIEVQFCIHWQIKGHGSRVDLLKREASPRFTGEPYPLFSKWNNIVYSYQYIYNWIFASRPLLFITLFDMI